MRVVESALTQMKKNNATQAELMEHIGEIVAKHDYRHNLERFMRDALLAAAAGTNDNRHTAVAAAATTGTKWTKSELRSLANTLYERSDRLDEESGPFLVCGAEAKKNNLIECEVCVCL